MKKTYFSHEANARNDEKCIALRMTLGLEGYGLYLCLIERLMQESDYSHVTDYNTIAFDLRCSNQLVKTVVEDFGLFAFTEDGKRFYSESLIRRMLKADEISAQNRINAQKRWGNGGDDGTNSNANAQDNDATALRPHTKTDATAMRPHTNFDAKKGSKQKEGREVNVPPQDFSVLDSENADTDSSSEQDEENISPFELLREYWNRKAERMTKVKMSPIIEMIASPTIANNLLSRIEEYGGDIERILIAIDRIEDAEFFHGQTLGVTTFLKDTMFPKFLNREWGDFKKDKRR